MGTTKMRSANQTQTLNPITSDSSTISFISPTDCNNDMHFSIQREAYVSPSIIHSDTPLACISCVSNSGTLISSSVNAKAKTVLPKTMPLTPPSINYFAEKTKVSNLFANDFFPPSHYKLRMNVIVEHQGR